MKIGVPFGRWFARSYGRVSPAQALLLVDQGAVLVDIRDAEAWYAGHAPGALHVPFAQVRLVQLPATHIVTISRSGTRSARAAAMLAREGCEVSHLRGGMRAWAHDGLPLETEDGHPGRIA